MVQKNVTLSLDEEIYGNYQKYCESNAIALSKSVEKFMLHRLEERNE